jgi:hypothetical protein
MNHDLTASRPELVERMRARVIDRGTPRLQLMVMVGVAGAGAFLASLTALQLGLTSMTVRYPLAVVAGYLVFLLMVRLWIAWQRWGTSVDLDVDPELLNMDVSLARAGGDDPPALFDGGGSGGAGASGTYHGAVPVRGGAWHHGASRDGGNGFGVDLDDAWPIALAVVCALGGLAAVLYVVYFAPVLLAEVALDAAVVSGLYRRLRREDLSDWTVTTVRHTIVPATVLVLFAAGLGFALHVAAPDAVSIGGVIRELST